jgi:hypothetical protein
MSRTYSRRTCRCGREVSANGAAWHSHMMGHVRKGEAVASLPKCLGLDPYAPILKRWEFRWTKEPADATRKQA